MGYWHQFTKFFRNSFQPNVTTFQSQTSPTHDFIRRPEPVLRSNTVHRISRNIGRLRNSIRRSVRPNRRRPRRHSENSERRRHSDNFVNVRLNFNNTSSSTIHDVILSDNLMQPDMSNDNFQFLSNLDSPVSVDSTSRFNFNTTDNNNNTTKRTKNFVSDLDSLTFTSIEDYLDQKFEHYFENVLFLPHGDRSKAINFLRNHNVGSYVVRRKHDQRRKPYVISVKCDEITISHLWIRCSVEKIYYPKINEPDYESVTCNRLLTGSATSLLTDTDSIAEKASLPGSTTLINIPKNSKTVYESIPLNLSSKPQNFSFKDQNDETLFYKIWFHIDQGLKTFDNLYNLLRYYEGHEMSSLFQNCKVVLKSAINMKDDHSSGIEEQITYFDSILFNSEYSNCINDENIFEENGHFVYKINDNNLKIKTILFAVEDFKRNDYSELKFNKNVVKTLHEGEKVYLMHDNDKSAIDNNWLKCVYKGCIVYVPRNFVKFKLF